MAAYDGRTKGRNVAITRRATEGLGSCMMLAMLGKRGGGRRLDVFKAQNLT